jgi:hypothetical protein
MTARVCVDEMMTASHRLDTITINVRRTVFSNSALGEVVRTSSSSAKHAPHQTQILEWCINSVEQVPKQRKAARVLLEGKSHQNRDNILKPLKALANCMLQEVKEFHATSRMGAAALISRS